MKPKMCVACISGKNLRQGLGVLWASLPRAFCHDCNMFLDEARYGVAWLRQEGLEFEAIVGNIGDPV